MSRAVTARESPCPASARERARAIRSRAIATVKGSGHIASQRLTAGVIRALVASASPGATRRRWRRGVSRVGGTPVIAAA